MEQINNKVWNNRRRSLLVKQLMYDSNIPLEEFAEALDCNVNYFNCKLNRNSFTIDDILILLELTGYELLYKNKRDRKATKIDFHEWFSNSDPTVIERLKSINKKKQGREKVRKEYEQLKQQIQKMKDEYNFKD